MVTIGIASIAHWKNAGLMSWEAIAAGVVPTRISSLRRHNLKAQKSTALSRNRQSPKAEFVALFIGPGSNSLPGPDELDTHTLESANGPREELLFGHIAKGSRPGNSSMEQSW